jgi:hypothetical protein
VRCINSNCEGSSAVQYFYLTNRCRVFFWILTILPSLLMAKRSRELAIYTVKASVRPRTTSTTSLVVAVQQYLLVHVPSSPTLPLDCDAQREEFSCPAKLLGRVLSG